MIVTANVIVHLSIRLPNGETMTRDFGMPSGFSFDQIVQAAHATKTGPDASCEGSDIWKVAKRYYEADLELRARAEQARLDSKCS